MVAMLIPPMLGGAALMVDVGRVAAARAALQTAADATAIHASRDASSNTAALALARAAVIDHRVAGETPAIDEVRVGHWDAADRTIHTASGARDAVGVQLSTGVSLLFGPIFGFDTRHIVAVAVARRAADEPAESSGPGFVSLSSMSLEGNVDLDSYDSNSQSFFSSSNGSGSRQFTGQTNGSINMNNGVSIWGNMRMQSSSNITANNAGFEGNGARENVAEPITLAPESAPPDATWMGNVNLPPGHHVWPGGKYALSDFVVQNGATIEFSGPVELFLNGNTNIQGKFITHENKPKNFRLVQQFSAGININPVGTTDDSASEPNLAIDIYCPGGPVNVNGNINLYGRIQAKQITLNQADFYVDLALSGGTSSEGGTAGGGKLVR